MYWVTARFRIGIIRSMGRTIPLNVEMQRRARKLYVPGVFGIRRVARELGISETSVRRYVDEGFRARNLADSREAKKRRTGICEICGGETRYNGHAGRPVSEICAACNVSLIREIAIDLRGSGHQQGKTLEFLASGPKHFMEICRHLGKPQGAIGPHLLRLMKHGFVVRLRRGVYALARDQD